MRIRLTLDDPYGPVAAFQRLLRVGTQVRCPSCAQIYAHPDDAGAWGYTEA